MSAAASSSSSSSSSGPVDPSRLPSGMDSRGIPHSDERRWKVIYPIYLNVNKKISEGRKLPKSLCVEKPSVYDIADMCVFLKLNYVIEDKCYSRDFWERGRVRVQLKDDEGKPLRPEFPDRRTLLRFMGAKIPNLKTRAQRLANAPKEETPMAPQDDKEDRETAKAQKKAEKKAAKKRAKK